MAILLAFDSLSGLSQSCHESMAFLAPVIPLITIGETSSTPTFRVLTYDKVAEQVCSPEKCDGDGLCMYDPESCGTTECADFMLSINDDAYAELEAGLATCTNGLEEYGAGGEYEGSFRAMLIGIAHACGVESGLSNTPFEERAILIREMSQKTEIACPPTNCDDKGMTCMYNPERCSTTASADYLSSSLDDDAYAKLEAPLQCTNERVVHTRKFHL